ncbi:MAG: 3D-(3,5/4)-trihydroxycyclohexane-1,2-dione acylhydrolase (decyclizing) [Elusimicrobia bacterium]|nr:3D-(3,5/4)-trihydroxycyclohexane-1,2-dione acylhydrolase (decyclizing) [Elusimicrobiota bacterium]
MAKITKFQEPIRTRDSRPATRNSKLTAAQALVEVLIAEGVEIVLGIFGHGNVQLGQALYERKDKIRYIPVKNEQNAVHLAIAYARQTGKPLAVTTSVGPGATNLVTGAAAARINRLPVLLLPGEIFADGIGPVLQQLEGTDDRSANSCLKPVAKYWTRLARPEQLQIKLREAFEAMMEPGNEGPAVICLPMDVQAMAHEYDLERLTAPRHREFSHIVPDERALKKAVQEIEKARRPFIIAGGGVLRSKAMDSLKRFAEYMGAPVAETQAGKGSLLWDHPLNVFSIGPIGTACGNRLSWEADLIIGIGTRYSDFTTASETAFSPQAAFININISAFDVGKERAIKLWGDADTTLKALLERFSFKPRPPDSSYFREISRERQTWLEEADRWLNREGNPLRQTRALKVISDFLPKNGVIVNAAGSLPGDLHKLWRCKDPEGLGYLMEYGYSTMGFEIAAGLGAKLAHPQREVIVLVGDMSFLMASQEIATAVQWGIPYTIVVFDNHGGQSIRGLQRSSGFEDFAMEFRKQGEGKDFLPLDFVKLGEGLGAKAVRADDPESLLKALKETRSTKDRPTVIHLEVDRNDMIGNYGGWWDVPQPEINRKGEVTPSRLQYIEQKKRQIVR